METTFVVVVIREADGRYTAFAPALQDCASIGDTLPTALQMVEEAIGLYLSTLEAKGWPVPEDDPRVAVDMTDVAEAFVYRLPIRPRAAA
jgi:predicted RNase H-like HicB family nuclease